MRGSGDVRFASDIFCALWYLLYLILSYLRFHFNKIFLFLGAYFYGMTSSGLNVLDHMYMAEVVAMILVTVMTVQVNRFTNI